MLTEIYCRFTINMFLNNQHDDDSPEPKHVTININSIVVVLTDDIL